MKSTPDHGRREVERRGGSAACRGWAWSKSKGAPRQELGPSPVAVRTVHSVEPMKSKANTVAEYLDSLTPERRGPLEAVRRVILGNLDADLRECMQYGVIGYCVPHSVWPHGHHTRPELPLMYMGLSSQKNDMVVYMLFLKDNPTERAWFEKAWKATGRKLHLDVGGMGCCLRFRKVEQVSLEVVGEAMGRVPVKWYLEHHSGVLAKIGKQPGGKAGKKNATAGEPRAKAEGRKAESKKAKSTRRPQTPKVAKKKAARKARTPRG